MQSVEYTPQPLPARVRLTELLARHHARIPAPDANSSFAKQQERQRYILGKIPDAVIELFEPATDPLLSEKKPSTRSYC